MTPEEWKDMWFGKGDEWKPQEEPLPKPQYRNNLNQVVMNPQPLRELNEVTSDYKGVWGTFVMGKGMAEPFLNQPPSAVGVKKENGIWYWLLND